MFFLEGDGGEGVGGGGAGGGRNYNMIPKFMFTVA